MSQGRLNWRKGEFGSDRASLENPNGRRTNASMHVQTGARSKSDEDTKNEGNATVDERKAELEYDLIGTDSTS